MISAILGIGIFVIIFLAWPQKVYDLSSINPESCEMDFSVNCGDATKAADYNLEFFAGYTYVMDDALELKGLKEPFNAEQAFKVAALGGIVALVLIYVSTQLALRSRKKPIKRSS